MRRSLLIALAGFLLAQGGSVSASAREAPDRAWPLYGAGELSPPEVAETTARLPDNRSEMAFNVSAPRLEMFRPARGKGNGTAIIVAPGGGFVGVDVGQGGATVARALAARGFTAFLLVYRTIRSTGDPAVLPPVHEAEMNLVMNRAATGLPTQLPPFAGEPHAVEDGARAVALVRRNARAWGIAPNRVGVLGFSAGAYLAADLAIGPKSARPDFVGLIYGGLRGPLPADAPPAFIAAAADDPMQPADAPMLFSAWRKAGVAAELHVYERGGHGFTLMKQATSSDQWFADWLAWIAVMRPN